MKPMLGIAFILLSFGRPTSADLTFMKLLGQEKPRATEMNGIRFQQYHDFLSWPLVTVRFRQDTNELRFVYANELAMKTMKSGKTDYQDGAVFAKYAQVGESDPAFPDSLAPSGLLRIQFMVRDRKRYADANGWGYAIFDSDGFVYPSESKNTVSACIACHHLAAARGDVFSQLMNPLTPSKSTVHQDKKPILQKNLVFSDAQIDDIPSRVVQFAHLSIFPKVRLLKGKLTESEFLGTYYEILPALLTEARRAKIPAILVENGNRKFAVAARASPSNHPKEAEECKKRKLDLFFTVLGGVEKSTSLGSLLVRTDLVCQ